MSTALNVVTMPKYETEDKDYYFRQAVYNLPDNPGAEMLRYGKQRADVISLAQGEGDLKTPDFITDAAYKAMQEGKTFYGSVLGHPELRQEISNYYSRIYSLNIPTNRIYVTGSGTTAMHLALTSVLDEGDEVVAVTPIWKNLLGAVEIAQATTKQVSLRETEDGWNLDLDELFTAVTPKTKALLIVSPSNPTGWVMKPHEIEQVLEFARERDLWIIADEVYGRITYDMPRAPSFLDYSSPEDRLYVVNSFSKSWAMTGWRLGWLVGPAQAEPIIRDIALYDNLGPCNFSQYGAIAALRYGEDFIQKQLDLWRSNRDLMMDRLSRNNRMRLSKPEATFYGFFQVEGEENCMEFSKRLIDEAALSLAPGCSFGKSSKSYMRLCFAVSEERLNAAIDRLEKLC